MSSSSISRLGALPAFLVIAVGLAATGRAQLVSISDGAPPSGSPYIIGLDGRSSNNSVLITTVDEVYEGVRVGGNFPAYSKILVASVFAEGLDTTSTVALAPGDFNRLVYTNISSFAPAVSTLLIPAPNTFSTSAPPSSGLALGMITFDAGNALYYFQGTLGIQKFAYNSYTTPTLTFGTSGPGLLTGQSCGLAVKNNVAYALDLAGDRVVRFDATTGSYLGDFDVTGAHATSRIAVSGNGRLYLTTGNGGGNIYDATTGSTLNSFVAGAITPGTHSGNDGLFLDDTTGYFYTYDTATGLHVFQDFAAIPEPGTWTTLAGLGALGTVLLRKRRRA